mgnify:CR=1 FL=1
MDRDEYPGIVEAGQIDRTREIPVALLTEADELPADGPDTPTEAPAPAWPADTGPRDAVRPEQIIEALLFASDTPLSPTRLAELAGITSLRDVRLHIAELNAKYLAAKLSFRIEEIARGFQMLTQPAFQPWLARLAQQQAQTRLSPAALETLSIIAYKQPVIRADIEAIRGVGCGEVLNRLRELGLVRIVGRAEIVGRPLLYGTTRKFLDVFGLADLDDLPPLEALALRRARPQEEDAPPRPAAPALAAVGT